MLHLATFGCTLRIDCKVGNMSFNRTVLMDFCVSAHCWDWTCESPTTMWTVSLTLEMMLLVSIVHSLAVIMLNWAVCHSLVSLSCGEASVCDWVVLPNGMVKEHAVNCFLLGMRFACPHMSTLSFKVQMKFTQPQRSTWINHNDEVTCCCSNVLESQSPNCFVVLHCFAILLGGGLPTIPTCFCYSSSIRKGSQVVWQTQVLLVWQGRRCSSTKCMCKVLCTSVGSGWGFSLFVTLPIQVLYRMATILMS